MGIGTELKKGFKKIGKAFFSPWTLLGPVGFGLGFLDNEKKEAEKEIKKEEQLQALAEKQEADAQEAEFRAGLEKKRKSSKNSDVIFAGILGSKSREGLGGRKTLLGV